MPKNERLSFPLFRETTKEDAISYQDWRSEIEDALARGHDAAKVKEAMFASLEGMARDNAKMIDENRDLHITRILDGLDSLYGVSMTFQSLNTALCGLQQKPMESAHTYYNHMAQITVIPERAPWQPLQAGGVSKNVQRLLLCRALTRELPYGGSFEGPAPYHPFGFSKGTAGTGRKQCPDMHPVPAIHVYQIDAPTEAGGTLPLTASC